MREAMRTQTIDCVVGWFQGERDSILNQARKKGITEEGINAEMGTIVQNPDLDFFTERENNWTEILKRIAHANPKKLYPGHEVLRDAPFSIYEQMGSEIALTPESFDEISRIANREMDAKNLRETKERLVVMLSLTSQLCQGAVRPTIVKQLSLPFQIQHGRRLENPLEKDRVIHAHLQEYKQAAQELLNLIAHEKTEMN